MGTKSRNAADVHKPLSRTSDELGSSPWSIDTSALRALDVLEEFLRSLAAKSSVSGCSDG